MRQLAARLRATTVFVFVLTPLLAAGCDKLQPQGASSTMQQLRQGSEKVCIASDVQKVLHDLILPKPVEDPDEPGLRDDLIKAGSAISFRYDLTTLQAFDQSVAKAICSTTLTLTSGTSHQENKVQLTYSISPSAETPTSFIVTLGDDSNAKTVADAMVGADFNAIAAKQTEVQQARAAQEQKTRLLTTISEKWLVGAWIGSDQTADHCGNGQAVWFERGHVLSGVFGAGRWSLVGDQLHVISDGDETMTITQADAVSMTFERPSGEQISLRRCTRQEVETLPQADTPAGDGA